LTKLPSPEGGVVFFRHGVQLITITH